MANGINNFTWETLDQSFPSFTRTALPIIETPSLLNLTIVVLRNLSYEGSSLLNQLQPDLQILPERSFDLGFSIACKSRYFESACMSAAATISQTAMLLIWGISAAATLGRNQTACYNFRKHWMQLGLTISAFAISSFGVFSGKYATLALGALYYGLYSQCINGLSSDIQRNFHVLSSNAGPCVDSIAAMLNERFSIDVNRYVPNLRTRIQNIRTMDQVGQVISEIFASAFNTFVGQNAGAFAQRLMQERGGAMPFMQQPATQVPPQYMPNQEEMAEQLVQDMARMISESFLDTQVQNNNFQADFEIFN